MNLRRVSSLSSYAAVLVAAAVLVGLGVYIGRELVRPERRAWEGTFHLQCPAYYPPPLLVCNGIRAAMQRQLKFQIASSQTCLKTGVCARARV